MEIWGILAIFVVIVAMLLLANRSGRRDQQAREGEQELRDVQAADKVRRDVDRVPDPERVLRDKWSRGVRPVEADRREPE